MGFHAIKHFKTITHHKILVAKGCFRVGLYRQGLLHDMSKYSPSEFLVGCKYYQGFRSPNDAERRAKGYSSSWLHHKGRNKHHFDYWLDYSIDKPGHPIEGSADATALCGRDADGPDRCLQDLQRGKLYGQIRWTIF